MAKKRKDSPQSSTLDHFFKKNGASTPGSNKKPKLRTPASSKASKSRFTVSPDEIIIIDSDDDQANPFVIEDSSDIEVVEDGPSNASTSQVVAPKTRPTITQPDFATTGESADDFFGEPSLLVEKPRPNIAGDDGPDFGAPTLLHGKRENSLPIPNGESSVPHAVRPSPYPLQRPSASDDPRREQTSYAQQGSAGAESSEQLWELGDDEADLGGADAIMEDVDEADIEQSLQEDIQDCVQTCPICNTPLDKMSQLDIQAHVNQCVDAIPPTPPRKRPPINLPSSTASSSKVLKPLSALQPFSTPPRDVKSELKDVARSPGVFSMLMSSHKENEAWKEAAMAEDRNFRPTKANGGRRKAPFYKVMQGMPIAVDAFRYGAIPGVTAYFLTHAHSDHYTNLSGNWRNGPIYCSQGTANLIVHMLGVDRKWVHALPMDVPTVIPDTGGVSVTLIEANHCPGSCLFLFEGVQTVNAGDSAYKSPFVGSKRMFRYLHCGDFRASPQHAMHPAVHGKKLDHVYLDTTYLDPKYCFPPQPQVISACAELAKRLVHGESLAAEGPKNTRVDSFFSAQGKSKGKGASTAGKTLVIVGTYSIGKERVVKAIAKALQTKVYSDARKAAILRCEADSELDAMLTSNPLEAGVHLLPLGTIASDRLKLYLEKWNGHFTRVIGFRPTGWTFTQASGSDTQPSIPSVIAKSQAKSFTWANINPMKASTMNMQLFGVPYSEHSSFFELTCFALSVDWGRMIATVNVGSEASRGKMAKWVEKWEAEKKKRGKVEVVQYRSPDYW